METGSNIEHIQIHINTIETIYQKTLNIKTSPGYLIKIIKKIFFLERIISSFNFQKSLIFLNDYFKKAWYFFPPFWHLKNWFYFWYFNTMDLIFKKNLNFLIENIYEIINIPNFICSDLRGVSPNSHTILSLYAGTMAFSCIPRKICVLSHLELLEIYLFVKKLKIKKGPFKSSFIGESDSRVIYCTFIILSLFNILTIEISSDCQIYLKSIQIDDGSFSENKHTESHGAFLFCCLANLIFYSQKNIPFHLPISFKYWINQKLRLLDFSIQGRSSKLTDCCYSFWIGAALIIGSINLFRELINGIIFNRDEMVYGFSDKIGRNLDLYHTAYTICGLSLLNFEIHNNKKFLKSKKEKMMIFEYNFVKSKINPVYGIRESKLLYFFGKQMLYKSTT